MSLTIIVYNKYWQPQAAVVLAANAVRHGAGQGRVQLWVTGDGVRCQVIDAGALPEEADGDRPDTSSRDAAQWPVEHGHGLWLVHKVGDQAGLESGPSGTVAVVTFRFASRMRDKP